MLNGLSGKLGLENWRGNQFRLCRQKLDFLTDLNSPFALITSSQVILPTLYLCPVGEKFVPNQSLSHVVSLLFCRHQHCRLIRTALPLIWHLT